MALRAWVSSAMPAAVVAFPTLNSTAQEDTTTSFAEMPAMSATTICQNPKPMGAKKGTIHWPIWEPKVWDMSREYPWGPKFKRNHMRMEAMKMVVPALVR